jgi:hypothetical protein
MNVRGHDGLDSALIHSTKIPAIKFTLIGVKWTVVQIREIKGYSV